MSLTCSSCARVLLPSAFSNSSLNRLRHGKIAPALLLCQLCTSLKERLLALNTTSTKADRSHRSDRDPSLAYIGAPSGAPVVGEAVAYFSRYARVRFRVHVGEVRGWRTSAKLCVRDDPRTGALCIGLFRPGSHEVVPCVDSIVHHPSINVLAHIVLTACALLGVRGYCEATDKGQLKYLLFSVERASGRVQLTLVWNALPVTPTAPNCPPDPLHALADTVSRLALASGHPHLLHSIWANYHQTSRHVNAITGRDATGWVLLSGCDSAIEERVQSDMHNPPTLLFPPTVFRQANLDGFGTIVREIRRWVPLCGRVVELYAGVGTIGLNLVDRVLSLHCSDENPHNKRCFDLSVQGLSKAERHRCSYTSESAAAVAIRTGLLGSDVVVVDPPRKGLDAEVLAALTAEPLPQDEDRSPQRLIYVSCGFKAFRRDCDALVASGCWSLVHAEGHVLFPGADHIEVLAVLDRVSEYL